MAAFSWTLAGSESSKQRGKVRIFLWTTRFLLIGVACGTASKWVLFGTGAKVDGLGVALDLKKWMKKIFSLMKHFFHNAKIGFRMSFEKCEFRFFLGKSGFLFFIMKTKLVKTLGNDWNLYHKGLKGQNKGCLWVKVGKNGHFRTKDWFKMNVPHIWPFYDHFWPYFRLWVSDDHFEVLNGSKFRLVQSYDTKR